jgi:hypothetical protein
VREVAHIAAWELDKQVGGQKTGPCVACRRQPAPKPLDLSGVVDVREPSSAQKCREEASIVQHSEPGCVLPPDKDTHPAADCLCQGQGHCFKEAYTFPAHPGFVLLPGALSAPEQLSLVCDAFLR